MDIKFPYEDIVDLPHHVSERYPQASMSDRAARFSPFAAISGYEEMVEEAARVTQDRIDLDESAIAKLNDKLRWIADCGDDNTEITITYFKPDEKKEGGSYLDITGVVRRIDEYERIVLLSNGTKIPIDHIYAIQGGLNEDAEY